MPSLRILVIAGLLAYRALFNWLSPWIYVPSLLVLPLVQIFMFTYLGRSAGLESDEFFLIGNALQAAASPCLIAMAATIAGEREERTLAVLLCTPAPRVPLFLGRSLPAIANAWVVTLFSLTVGGACLDVRIPSQVWPAVALTVLVACLSCTGLAILVSALGLRLRDTSTMPNGLYGVLLIFCGVNVPLASLPGWMGAVAQWLPLTRSIASAREVASGGPLSGVAGALGTELLLALVYTVAGLLALRYFEEESRRRATLGLA